MGASQRFLECTDAGTVAWERLGSAPVSDQWSRGSEPDAALHRIHAYPAKFPAFLTAQALDYAASSGRSVERVGDVFCGCGTVAHEARRRGLEFWGCDINPVAILIAQAKATPLDPATLRSLARAVAQSAKSQNTRRMLSKPARDYLLRWHGRRQYERLAKLLNAIEAQAPDAAYLVALKCAFSSILKSCSYWQAWAQKPTYDPDKEPAEPVTTFSAACERMARAHTQAQWKAGRNAHLELADVRTVRAPQRKLQTLISSAPYATSVDYVELHKLSAAWLGHHDSMARLRQASIGTRLGVASLHRTHAQLNAVGRQVVFTLLPRDREAAAAVARYYVDMQLVARRCLDFLTPDGIAVFVIGNARLRGLDIDNAAHFTEALLEAGFTRVRVVRRRTANKSTSPFRDTLGRLSRQVTSIRQYEEEFVLIAHRGET